MVENKSTRFIRGREEAKDVLRKLIERDPSQILTSEGRAEMFQSIINQCGDYGDEEDIAIDQQILVSARMILLAQELIDEIKEAAKKKIESIENVIPIFPDNRTLN